MATVEVGTTKPVTVRQRSATASEARETSVVMSLLYAVASLRLTVTLFGLSIFLIFAGTLAQVDNDVWEVVNHKYFHVWFAWVEWQALARLVEMFYRANWDGITGGFYFPGGKLIGICLAANLLSAHALRFKIVATGKRLWIGLGFLAAGLIGVWLAIASGTNDTVESELSPAFNNGLWHLLRGGVAGLALTGAYLAVLSYRRIRGVEWSLLVLVDLLLVGLAAWLFFNPDARLDPSGLRILWQLAKGTGAALLLLAGCIFLFHRRAGVVVLHGGIGLLMASVFWTGMAAEEANMAIDQGEKVGIVYDNRETELAVIDSASPDEDRVTVVPQRILKDAAASGEVISHPDLPFDVKVIRYLQNSLPEPVPTPNPATAGAGLQIGMEDVRAATGVSTSQGIDFPSAYVELLDKKSGNALGTYLISTWGEDWLRMRDLRGAPFLAAARQLLSSDQQVAVGGKPYDIALRFKRTMKDYTVTLKEFKFDRYVGTNTPKNYSSLVQLRNPAQNIDRESLIWMNNPLRYGNDTLYQSSFDENQERGTILQVVTNPGWMAPYIACMVVGIGMGYHFVLTLLRFIDRRKRDALRSAAVPTCAPRTFTIESFQSPAVWFPTLVVLLMAGYVAGKARVPTAKIAGMDVHGFGALPLADGGRIKPFETLARNTLQVISGRQEVEQRAKTFWERITRSGEKPIPATVWLLDCIAEKKHAEDYRVFRIDNPDVLEVLGLEPRPGFFRYSYQEISHKMAERSAESGTPPQSELDHQIGLATQVDKDHRDLFQAKIIELADKRQLYQAVVASYRSPAIRMDQDQERLKADLQFAAEYAARLREAHSPRSVPPINLEEQWQTLFEAELNVLVAQVLRQEVNPATPALAGSLLAYAKDDAREFNSRLRDLQEAVNTYAEEVEQAADTPQLAGLAPAERLNLDKIKFEVFFNHFSPFYYAAVLYLIAFALAALSWLGWSQPLSRASTWLIAFTFLLHTFALVGRIYISGRPPVTNLYSSAVFIGWACVLLGLVLEAIYKMGVGNIVASVVGFATLVIAHFLSLDGDTFTVLQAVLDTQFWLATHVVCITLGYSTTFLAGILGILYVLFAYVFQKFDGQQRQQLTRMIYGTTCFAIFFSFVGTVLGGLWADDSWGRFWGWDPKENGALLIVLWNAIVLHARWGALVGPRGLATLAVAGNIVTAWSWFGVNELGVGLHSYGFSEGTSRALLFFVLSQVAVIVLGCLPGEMFRGGRNAAAT